MAFNASGEKWDGRKHGNALITGALAGVIIGVASALSNPEEADNASFIVTLVTTFLAAAGVDRLRSSTGHMITKENIQKLRASCEAGTAPPAPPAVTEEKKP